MFSLQEMMATDRGELRGVRETLIIGNLDRIFTSWDAQSMASKQAGIRQGRAPRIRVPNSERALFSVNGKQFVGVLQRLSTTGGSSVLAKGPIAKGTLGEMSMKTVYGTVSAHIEFLQTGADGIPLAQAFRFLAMDETSAKRFGAAAEQMVKAGFSDARVIKNETFPTFGKLLHSVRQLAATMSKSR